MENNKRMQKNKPGAGISILGFLLTVILLLAFICNGVLLGLKTTVLKGSGIIDIIENLDAYDLAMEVMISEEELTLENEMMLDVVQTVLESETVKTTAEDILDSVVNGTEVNLSGIEEVCAQEMRTWFVGSFDKIIEVVGDTSGEINLESLAANEELQGLQETYGIDVSGMIMEYVEETHGQTSIAAEELDLEGLKEASLKVIDEELTPAFEEMAGEMVTELNKTINEELIGNAQDNELAQTIVIVEKALRSLNLAVIVGAVVLLVLAFFEVLLYWKFKNRAFRNIGIASLLGGIFEALIGGAVKVAKMMVTEFQTQTADPIETVVMEFIQGHIHTIGNGFLIIAGVFVVIAMICFVLAGTLKKKTAEIATIE